jgi:hypothetical protein
MATRLAVDPVELTMYAANRRTSPTTTTMATPRHLSESITADAPSGVRCGMPSRAIDHTESRVATSSPWNSRVQPGSRPCEMPHRRENSAIFSLIAKAEVRAMEAKLIRETGANDPSISYSRTPRYRR